MKLNHECIRDILIYLEGCENFAEVQTGVFGYKEIWAQEIQCGLNKYSVTEIIYMLLNMEQADLVNLRKIGADNGLIGCGVKYITYNGHEFLDSIRDDNRWGAIKKGLSSIRDYSLSAISSIAEGMTSGAVSAYLAQR